MKTLTPKFPELVYFCACRLRSRPLSIVLSRRIHGGAVDAERARVQAPLTDFFGRHDGSLVTLAPLTDEQKEELHMDQLWYVIDEFRPIRIFDELSKPERDIDPGRKMTVLALRSVISLYKQAPGVFPEFNPEFGA